jgi:hypothetical protein
LAERAATPEHERAEPARHEPEAAAALPPGARPRISPAKVAERARHVFERHGVELAIVAALAALAVFVRIARLEPIENGGDPLDNWYFVRQWAYENELGDGRLDHHASRFGIHWITWLAQTLFGTHPRVYYVAPIAASTVATVLTYVLGRLVSGRFVGVLAALLLLECPPFVSASSQLRPAIFETMYALAAAVSLVRFVDRAGRAAELWLSAAALFIFLAYLAHEPDAFLGPGALLVVWLKRRSFRDVLVFGGVLSVLLLVETASYAIFTQYASRVDVLSGSHLTRPGPPRTFGFLLERFTKAEGPIKLAYYPFFLAGPLLVALRRPVRETVPVFMAGSFLFLATFFVRSFDPLIVFIQNNDRYIFVTVPFAYVAILHAVALGVRALAPLLGRRLSLERRVSSAVVRAGGAAFSAALLFAVAIRAEKRAPRPHPLATIDSIYDTLNDTYRRRLPIIGKVSARKGNLTQVRTLHWAHKGFLRDEFFLENGRLRNFKYANLVPLGRNERYLPFEPELEPRLAKKLQQRGCALSLDSRGTFVVLSRKKRLPPRCDR